MRALLAWYFVAVWGAGYIATRIGLQYAPPFTFLTLRFCFGLLCLLPLLLWSKIQWGGRTAVLHLAVAGLLMHAVQLGASHYAQYLGMSAGVAALVISCQPLLTGVVANRLLGERLVGRQWLGILVGLVGVSLVVWHKIDVREVTAANLACSLTALGAVTAATLYQKTFSPRADLKAASIVQFAVTAAGMAPLALAVEHFKVDYSIRMLASVAFLVVFTSILGVTALWWLLRHGEATRVTSMMYLPPVFAVLCELALFGVVPDALMLAGMAVACAGVALTVWAPRWNSSTSSS